jgi:hypothetical protein
VWVPAREPARLIARVWFSANYIYALHFKVAEDTVMPVASIRFRKESEEQKHVAYGNSVLAKMSLGGTSLTQRTVSVFEHRIVMAETCPRQPSPSHLLNNMP